MSSNSLFQSDLDQGYIGYFNPVGISAIIPAGSGASGYSDAISCGGFTVCGIYTPATLTGSSFTFYAAPELSAGSGTPGTFGAIYTSIGQTYGAYTVTATESAYIALDPHVFQGAAFLQIKSSSNESASRTLTVMLKGLS